MTTFILTANQGKILGPLAKLLGMAMNGIYFLLSKIGITNVALTIIVFTVIIYLCLMPLTVKQQKFSKMTQIMNPEIQAIQKIRCISDRKLCADGHSAADPASAVSRYL